MTGASTQRPDGLDSVLANIGVAVIYMQTTERLIAFVLTHVLPGSPIKNLDDLTARTTANDRVTLGALVKKLRQRVELDDDFQAVLEAFLVDRNALIHDIQRVPRLDLATNEGIKVADRFVANLLENAEAVTKVFLALLTEWADNAGLSSGREPDILAYLGEFQGIANSIFFRKPTTSN